METHTPISVAFSGSIPENYDTFLGTIFFEPYAKDLTKRIKTIQPKNLLELSAGTGRLTKHIAEEVNTDITATDINPSMINFAKDALKQFPIEWNVVDAVTLPYESESFDCIAIQFGVMFFGDKEKAFSEAYRVLLPGGTLIFNTWDGIRENNIIDLAVQSLQHFFPNDPPQFFSIPFSYNDLSRIENEVRAGGFTNIKIETVELSGSSNSSSDAAKGLVKGTPAITAIEERNPKMVNEVIDYLKEQIESKYGEKDLVFPLKAFVVVAKKGK